MPIHIRQATLADLPAIHDLLIQSFAAMGPHSILGTQFWINGAVKLNTTELSTDNFQSSYSMTNGNFFWVAETETAVDDGINAPKVVGCIGLKNTNVSSNSAELVRMSVDASVRRQGVGRLLVSHLIDVARESGVKKVVFTTGNPESARFYEAMGFQVTNYWLYYYGVRLLMGNK
jgi:N-acetylglutamate synthase-like GNAT family acetyltransferase